MSLENILYSVIIYPVVLILEFIFVFFQKVFRETGLSVIGISAAISLLTLPLYTVAEKWQRLERDTQKKLKPKIDAIKSVFGGDEQYMILSVYYRQNHYHPIYAMRSTFGLLIQVPFFIAAYSFLSRLDALKGAPFLFISDMSLPDASLLAGGASINLLPLLMTAVNCAAAALYTKDFSLKEKLQLYLMAFIFLVLLYNAPSGLVIYWTTNNIFSLFKNLYTAINFKYRNRIPATLVSLTCIFLVYYILVVHKGSEEQRRLIALFALIMAALPWLLILRKKDSAKPAAPASTGAPLFLLSLAAIWILTGLWLPSTLVASSPAEFSFIPPYSNPLFFIVNTAFQALGLFVFWPLCLYLLFSARIKNIFSLLAVMLFPGALLNVFAFPGNYGLISPSIQFFGDISHSRAEVFLNIAALCCTAAAVFFLFRRVKKAESYALPFAAIGAVVLLALSLVNIAGIQKSYGSLSAIHDNTAKKSGEIAPLFSFSTTGKNIAVIMLDRASSAFFPFILEEDPSLREAYSGFVYYPNTVSFNGYTSIGAPPVFGGYEYTPREINRRASEPLVKKHNEALLLLPSLLSEAGYRVTVTDPPYPNYSEKDDLRIYDAIPNVNAFITDSAYTELWVKEHDMRLPSASDILKRDILWYSLFRAAPPALRFTIYQRGDWCSSIPGQKITGMLNGYSVLDYLPALTEITDKDFDTALIMVNNTTHKGAFLEAPEYRPAVNVISFGTSPFGKETEYHINIAAFKRMADWFAYLKREGVYDNTRLILVSDHGPQINYVAKPAPEMPENFDNLHPVLLVKDFNAQGPLETDDLFMTNADVPSITLSGLIQNPVNPFTGREITTDAKNEPLYIAVSGSVHLDDPAAAQFSVDPKRDYYVRGNIFDPKNWEKAE